MDILWRIEQDKNDNEQAIMDRWLMGNLSDKEADNLLVANENRARRQVRVACGLTPEPQYEP